MKLSSKGEEFLKCYETLHDGDLSMIGLQPKLDAAGIWTEGYGHAMTLHGKFITIKTHPTLESVLPYISITSERGAEELLRKDISEREIKINNWLSVKLLQNQFDAIFLHTYNCGKSDTLYKLINTKESDKVIKNWWLTHYLTSGGVPMKGLKLRRMDEWETWLNSEYIRNYNLNRPI